jgi:hypothetical protein
VTWGLLHLGHLQLIHCKYVQSMPAHAKKDSESGDVSGETKLTEEYIIWWQNRIPYILFGLGLPSWPKLITHWPSSDNPDHLTGHSVEQMVLENPF